MPSARRIAIGIASAFGYALLALLCVIASALYHARLDATKAAAARAIEALFESEMRGRLVIGRFETLRPRLVVATDVALIDPQGRTVIRAKRIELRPDLRAFLQGTPTIVSAKLLGGEVELIDDGDGLPSFISSFEPDVRGDSSDEATVVHINGIELHRVVVRGELLGLQGIETGELWARGAIQVGDEVLVQVDEGHTQVTAPFPFVGDIQGIAGTISTVPHQGVSLRMRGTRVGTNEAVNATIRYGARDGAPSAPDTLHIEVDGQEVSTQTVRDVGFDWMPELAVPVNGRFALHGPIEDLTLDAQLSTSAGAANLHGRIATADGFEVEIETDRLDVSHAFAGGPDIVVQGRVRLAARPDEPDLRVDARVEPVQLGAFIVPAFVLHGVLEAERLRIDSLEAAHRGAQLSGQGHVGFDGDLAVDVAATIDDIARDPALGRFVPGASGRLHARMSIATADVRRGRLDLSGRIDLTNFSYSMVRAARLSLVGTAKGDPEQPALRVALLAKSVFVGDYPLGDADLRVTGGPREYKADGQIVREGERNFVLAAVAKAERGALVLEADSIELRVGTGAWRGALKGLRIEGDRAVHLELLRLANRSQRLEAKGSILARGPDEASVLLQGFDLSAIAAIVGDRFPLTEGNADAQLTLAGDLADPILQLQGALRGGSVQGVRDVNAVYFVAYESGALDLDAEVDLGERGLVQARGSGNFDWRRGDFVQALLAARYALSIGSTGLQLELAPMLRDAGIAGRVSGKLRIEGTLDAPELNGAIEFDPIAAQGLPPLQAVIEVNHSGLDLGLRASIGDMRGPLAVAHGHAEIPIRAALRDPSVFRAALENGPWHLNVQTIPRKLDAMPESIATLLPYPVEVAATADLRRNQGALSGNASWQATFEQQLTGTDCAVDAVPRARGTIHLVDDRVELQSFLLLGPRRLATVDVALIGPFGEVLHTGVAPEIEHVQARARFDMPNLERVPYLCSAGRGSLSGDLELDAGPDREPILVGEARASLVPHTVQQGARRKTRVRGCRDAPLEIHLEANANGEHLMGSVHTSGCHGGESVLDAKLPIAWNPLHVLPSLHHDKPVALELALHGAQLAPLLDRIPGVRNGDAVAHGTLRVAGTLRAPQLSGEVTLDDGKLYLLSMGQELSDLYAHITMQQSWAKIEALSARTGTGTVEVSGGLGFEGLIPRRAQLALRADDFPVQREGIETAWVTGSAAIDAQLLDHELRAAVKTHTLLVRLPDTENRALQALDPHPDVERSDVLPREVREPYAIQLQVDGRRGINVRRNDFDARLLTELAVEYRDPELRIGGYMEFRAGTFETLGRPFAIERGSMRFDGSTSLNPEVTLVATHRPEAAGSSPVTVGVTGTLAAPEVTFSSDACPGDTGAITYLISGQCVADDPDLAQDSESAQQAFTAGIAGSSVLTLLGTPKVAGVTPRVGVESRGHGYDTRFKAGVGSEHLVPKFMRKLVRRVYVQGAVSALSSDEAELTEAGTPTNPDASALDFLIELYFPHNIVGSGKYSPDTYWGIDVIWEP